MTGTSDTHPILHYRITALAILSIALLYGCGTPAVVSPQTPGARPAVLRLGYFANITHAQALLGLSRGDFQKALGNTRVETRCFNAGPAAVEALFSGDIDLAYLGPSPKLNAYTKSHGKAIRIISGSAGNGVAIVARKDSGIKSLADMSGKKISTPQYGNTQDVSARFYVHSSLPSKLREDGGTTEIFTLSNAEQISLMRLGKIDAAWAPEPWASRMMSEAGATLLADEKDLWPDKKFCTVVLAASTSFLEKNPDLVREFLSAHGAVTEWVNANRGAAADIANAQLEILVGKKLSKEVLDSAFARILFTTDPLEPSIREFARRSQELGFVKTVPNLDALFWKAPAKGGTQ